MSPQEKENILYVQDKRYSHLYSELTDYQKTYNVSWAAVEAYPDNLQYVPLRHLNRDMIKMAAEIDGFAIEHVLPHRLDNEICSIAVNQNGGALQFVPEHFLTPQLCFDAVKNNALALGVVPEGMRTKELCDKALSQNGEALEFIPKNYITSDMCLKAVQKNGWALEFVPEEMKTKDMCRVALTSTPDLRGDGYAILEFVPYADVCLEGLKLFQNSLAEPMDILSSINPKLINSEIAMYGVSMDPLFIDKVPVHLRSPELIMKAVSTNGLILSSIPEHKKTMELCEAAVKSLYPAMAYVPDKFKTAEFCAMAFEVSPFTIQDFPKEHLTHEVCEKAVQKVTVPEILKYIPFNDIHEKAYNEFCVDYCTTKKFLDVLSPKYLTQKLADIIFSKEPELFGNIPDWFKTEKMCESAVDKDGLNIKYVPEAYKTDELYMKAIRQEPLALGCIPYKWKNEEFYTAMVEENPLNLKGVPRDYRTADICLAALNKATDDGVKYLSVVSAVTDSRLLLEIFEQENDPEIIGLLVNVADRNTLTSKIALDAMSKNGKYLYMIPYNLITGEVADAAVKNYPRSLPHVPEYLRTPDMFLYIEKSLPRYNLHIPSEILTGSNIYSFHKKVEWAINKPLSYKEHKKLYNGEGIIINDVKAENRMIKRAELKYDRGNNKLKIQPVNLAVDNKQETSPKGKRRNISKRNSNKL